jgi:hypothetical protein
MTRRIVSRRTAIALIGAIPVSLVKLAGGEEFRRSREGLTQPVFRVSNRVERLDPAQAAHPLDPAITIAREGLQHIRDNVRDYSCTMVKQERINGVVNEPEYIFTEIRNRQVQNGRIVVPFSVYMYFLKPEKVKGREVIYVEGQNNGKMVAHEGSGLKAAFGAVWLAPDGMMAMQGQLYPITDAGIENLVIKLIERAQRDRQMGPVDVQFLRNAKINGRSCTVLQVMHHEQRPEYDFYVARIFIDDELNVPVRYAAYSWPERPGAKPEVIESYTYLNMKINVGLTDDDFNHEKKFKM